MMRFAASVTDSADARRALDELLPPLEMSITPGLTDLLLLFFTAHFEDELPEIVREVRAKFPNAALIGCSAEGTIGVDRELERVPSISLLAAMLPGVEIRPFHIQQEQLESVHSAWDWERLVGVAPESRPAFVAFGDPFRTNIHSFIEGINENFKDSALVGGVASAGREPGQNRLILHDEILSDGIVGTALTGNFSLRTIVSQGCRPIGRPLVITRGNRNIILELGGKPALEQLHQVLVNLSEEDEQLARQSLFVGRVIDEYKQEFSRGDFLIHNILGADRDSGALGIAGLARVGATVQFHVRDAASADEDLRAMLTPIAGSDVRGAALFGCNGRGTHMWPKPGHDISVLRELLGDVPTAGFFCGGEFGPIGGRNFVHGFTASIALFGEGKSEETA